MTDHVHATQDSQEEIVTSKHAPMIALDTDIASMDLVIVAQVGLVMIAHLKFAQVDAQDTENVLMQHAFVNQVMLD
jgi:hypothetical protein